MKPRDALRLLDLRVQPRRIEERLDRCRDIEDVRRLARRTVPRAVFDFLDGAADDETVKRRNSSAFERVVLTPRQLSPVAGPDTGTSLLGGRASFPVAIAPCGQNQLLHPEGEVAVAKAAATASIPYTAPAMGSRTLEDVAAASSGDRWFQVYLWRDGEMTRDLVRRADAAGYSTLVITVDTPTSGMRRRDLGHGLTIPPSLDWRGVVDAALHPRWAYRFLSGEMPSFANVTRPGDSAISTMSYVGAQFDPEADWKRVGSLVSEWPGRAVVKGILSSADAARAVAIGADAVVVSNHGGRQFGLAPATLSVLPQVVRAVDGKAQVLIDSGITHGNHVAAAIAAGADGCLIGRAALYGLAAAGERGVDRCLRILREELERAMTLLGASELSDLARNLDFAENRHLWRWDDGSK